MNRHNETNKILAEKLFNLCLHFERVGDGNGMWYTCPSCGEKYLGRDVRIPNYFTPSGFFEVFTQAKMQAWWDEFEMSLWAKFRKRDKNTETMWAKRVVDYKNFPRLVAEFIEKKI